jgi:hypothetical protein
MELSLFCMFGMHDHPPLLPPSSITTIKTRKNCLFCFYNTSRYNDDIGHLQNISLIFHGTFICVEDRIHGDINSCQDYCKQENREERCP